MLRTRAVIEQINSATSLQKEAAVITTGSALLIGMVPILLSVLILAVARHFHPHELKALFLDGELLMLTNAVVAASSMLIGKERRHKDRFPGGDLFIFVGAFLLIASAALFCVIRVFDVINYKEVNDYLLASGVFVVFIAGISYAYYVVLLDGVCSTTNVDAEAEFDMDEAKMNAKRAARKRAKPVESAVKTA
jgi:hypothetical protein